MNAKRPGVDARVSRKPAIPPHARRFQLARTRDDSRTHNGTLISRDLVAANPDSGHRVGVVMRSRLNAFFAISVNSPSMSMVNFSCCVGSAPKARARGVTRRVTPQPMRAAVRTEAGADVCL